MKNRKLLFNITSIFVLLLISAFPLFKILIDVKNINNEYINLASIAYFLVLILLLIGVSFEIIYLIRHVVKSNMRYLLKILWILLIVGLNIFIIPYYYTKYVAREKNSELKAIIYLIPMVFFIFIFFFGINSYKTGMKEIEEKKKAIEAERNTYSTKDSITSFVFRHGYKSINVGEYDLYVRNDDKKVAFTAFTYEVEKYEQQTADDFINKGVNDISKDKEKFDLFKDKEVVVYEDKTITSITYVGKTADSSLCVYIISAITFPAKPGYLVYTVEVVTKNNYDKEADNLLEILKSAKIN